jgi:murein DD-endopeptidase MepM/ murein hydrolase activator NlpD
MTRGICAAIATFLVFPAVASAHTEGGRPLLFRWPADGVVTSPYGQDGSRWHPGMDIGILSSLDVHAAASGFVSQIGFVQGFDGYGSVVVLQHGDGYSTLYAHLSKPLVQVGDYVGQGELIGEAGCTGWCTGTHLHFELRYHNIPIDPSLLILG